MTPGIATGRRRASARTPAFTAAPPTTGSGITVQYRTARAGLPAATTVRRVAALALMRPALVTVRFVGRREGRHLNSIYRHRDYATNVLTFVYDGDENNVRHPTRPLTGDIVLCVPVLRTEATAQGKALIAHCAHLLIHGFLHLQGLDHQRRDEAARMERREKALLGTLGYPDPYAP
jgi:probable rRNA maturation factor